MDVEKAKQLLGDVFSFIANDMHEVIQEFTLPQKAKVLDVGTGGGFLAILLALNNCQVITGEPEQDHSIYAKKDWLTNAEKVSVDHLIDFRAFDAKDMPFEDKAFDAIFFGGTLHHIDAADRLNALQECDRVSKSNAIICFFEPNEKTLKMARENDPSHPDAADPNEYIQGLNWTSKKVEGDFLDVFIFEKQSSH